jgi:hypothetical protein
MSKGGYVTTQEEAAQQYAWCALGAWWGNDVWKPVRAPSKRSAPLHLLSTQPLPASPRHTRRLVHKIKGAAAAAACEVPPTPAEAAWLDGLTLDALLAEFRASGEKFSRGASSAFRGVSWHKNTQKWQMLICDPAMSKREFSAHDTEEAAARAYDARARVLHGA